MKRLAGVSLAVRLLILVALVASGLGARFGPVAAQGEISTVIPAPDLPGVPGDVPVVGFTTLSLDGGEYQWQTTSRQTVDREDDPIETHDGFLLSIDQPIIVLKAGAPSRPVPAGNSLPLAEGDRVLPVASGDTPGNIVIVEFVALEDIGPDETPDQTLPVTLDPGTYTLALLDITNLGEDDPSPGQVIVEAAGPGFAISSTDDPAAGDVPLVVWLASIFRTGDAEPEADASPVDEIAEPEATEEEDDEEADAVDEEPTATEEDIEPTATEEDEEDTEPTATEEDDEAAVGDASPTARVTEDDSDAGGADSTTAPVLPGVPADIPVLTFTVLELPAGDYQWQTRSMTSLSRTDDPLTVHDGFLIAVDQPVIVLKAGAPSQPVQPGQSIVLKNGDRILPTSTGGTPANIVIVELVALEDIAANEEPDEVLPLTLEDGFYTLALLDISGVGEDGPTPGEIIAEAAGPGFGISADEETGVTEEAVTLDWLVSIFPATEGDLPGGGSDADTGDEAEDEAPATPGT
jgi:hypothetical protein